MALDILPMSLQCILLTQWVQDYHISLVLLANSGHLVQCLLDPPQIHITLIEKQIKMVKLSNYNVARLVLEG